MTISFNNDTAQRKIKDFTVRNYKKLKIVPGNCRFNYKCHYNAVHEALCNNEKKIAMVMCIENGFPYIHFINFTDKKFVDNTLGVWCATQDYYFVRWIKKKEFFSVNDIFKDYRKYLQKQLSWWVRNTNNESF